MKKLNLNIIVSVGEIISSLAIVISLLYVVYEYERSNTLTNRDVENIIYNRMMEMDRLVIENSDLAELILSAIADPEQLTQAEQLRYLAYEHIFYDSWESAWYYYQEGILEEQNWNSWDAWFQSESKKKPFLSWQGNRKNFDGDFLSYVDDIFENNRRN